MTVLSVEYLSGVQITVPVTVPFFPVFVTATRGSGAPLIVRPRNDASIVAQEFWLMKTNEKFSRRMLTASDDMLTTKLAGTDAASVPAAAVLPRSSCVRARPSVAKVAVV